MKKEHIALVTVWYCTLYTALKNMYYIYRIQLLSVNNQINNNRRYHIQTESDYDYDGKENKKKVNSGRIDIMEGSRKKKFYM